jgi:hypothetical protein
MVRRYLVGAAFAACTVSFLVAVSGCSTGENTGSDEAAATPAIPSGDFNLAQTCVNMFSRMERTHDLDLQTGFIRWGCGDVPGVTDGDLGQEYCEYQLVQGGLAKIAASTLNQTDPASCVFTSVFTRDPSVGDPASLEPSLKTAMSDPANLGVAVTSNGVTQMHKGFNARGAATQLMSDCSNAGESNLQARLRVAACFHEYEKNGTNAAQLATACKANLAQDANWNAATALGVTIANAGDADYDRQRDISSCMAVKNAGLAWRNSDPLICSRSARDVTECSCSWQSVPNSLQGFEFTGWVNDELPTGCRLAKVNGADYPYLTICPVSAQEISDMPLNAAYARNMGNFCHDRFGKDLVLKLPIRALQNQGSCQGSDSFCSEYMLGQAPPASEPSAPTGPTTDPGTTAPATSTGPITPAQMPGNGSGNARNSNAFLN